MIWFFFKFTEVLHCDSEPCLNGGECEEDDESYTCTCQPGYSGDNCESKSTKIYVTGIIPEGSDSTWLSGRKW